MIRFHSTREAVPNGSLSPQTRAEVLVEALPYLRQFAGKTIVVKYGGAAMSRPDLQDGVMEDIALMQYVGLKPVLVHGGGPEINAMMRQLGHEPSFVGGLRVTDEAAVGIVEMVLSGKTNKALVTLLNGHGIESVGLSGKDANLLMARKLESEDGDLGYVGEIVGINAPFLQMLSDQGYVPVICSVAAGEDGQTYNVNADHAAGAVAAALKAEKLMVLTDVPGVFADVADPSSLISELDVQDAISLIASGKAGSGMIPKLEACVAAVQSGVSRAHLIDGREPHSLLIEILTDSGIGTMVTPLASWKPQPTLAEVAK
jgi:acetylglutamate kinase